MIASLSETELAVFHRYAGLSLPRHVAYPMPTWWHDVDEAEVAAMLQDSSRKATPCDLSLYVHIPFCEALCKFCACNRVIQKKGTATAASRTDTYVEALIEEIRRLSARLDEQRPLRQIHWGGGTPTYLSCEQIERIHLATADAFSIAGDAEISIEIDPRVTTEQHLATLRRLGFNRISMGVQDFEAEVQRHVHRVQPFEMVKATVDTCRSLGFESINFDLIYGMPYQTPDTIRRTVEGTISLSPDRIAYYHYAQIPEKIATQRGMDNTRLPDSETKLTMFLTGLELFTEAGYEFVGLDHFAKPDEGLSRALEDGTLQRNFQGMTTGGGLDLLGVGASAISQLQGVGYLQNIKETDAYIDAIKADCAPTVRGKRFTPDDLVRQYLIDEFYCTGEIHPRQVASRFDVDFEAYFARELTLVDELEADGLVLTEADGTIRATSPLGRVLMRNIAAVFDAYLHPEAYKLGEVACFSANA